MNGAIAVLERTSLVSPLGVRFWDTVTGAFITSGLAVTAYPVTSPRARTAGFPNRSSCIVFGKLPGIDPQGQGDDAYWSTVPRKPYVVEVVDTLGRFQPFVFDASLPFRGLFQLGCLPVDSPIGSPVSLSMAGIPLYSTAARQAPAGTAVVRADLMNAVTGGPAGWAVLEVRLGGQLLARGVADAQGHIVLIFHYPEPRQLATGSPPSTVRKPLIQQTWPVDLQALYTPVTPVPAIPDLCHVLNQAPASLWADVSPPLPRLHTTLEFGKDLVLRSGTRSTLLIGPAG